MIEGRGGSDFHETRKMLYERPELMHHLLEVNARAVTDYLNAQIEAGVQAVMIFDTWGGMLAGEAFHEFSLRYVERVCAGLRREWGGPRISPIGFTQVRGLWVG